MKVDRVMLTLFSVISAIALAHNSAGPKGDIVVPFDGKPTGKAFSLVCDSNLAEGSVLTKLGTLSLSRLPGGDRGRVC